MLDLVLTRNYIKYSINDVSDAVHDSKLRRCECGVLEIMWLWDRSPMPVMTLNCSVYYVISYCLTTHHFAPMNYLHHYAIGVVTNRGEMFTEVQIVPSYNSIIKFFNV